MKVHCKPPVQMSVEMCQAREVKRVCWFQAGVKQSTPPSPSWGSFSLTLPLSFLNHIWLVSDQSLKPTEVNLNSNPFLQGAPSSLSWVSSMKLMSVLLVSLSSSLPETLNSPGLQTENCFRWPLISLWGILFVSFEPGFFPPEFRHHHGHHSYAQR